MQIMGMLILIADLTDLAAVSRQNASATWCLVPKQCTMSNSSSKSRCCQRESFLLEYVKLNTPLMAS